VEGSDRIVTIPNGLSFLRICTVPVFVWLFVSDRESLAVGVYAAVAVTDFLDGYIARRTDSVTELGRLLDPLADRIFIAALAIALVATDTLPLWLASAIVGRDVIILALFPLVDRRVASRIPVNFLGKTATAGLLFGLTWLALSETGFFLADVGDEIGGAFTVTGAILYWVAGGQYAYEAFHRMAAPRGQDED
jgi:cardiolipin synthase